MAKYTGRRLNIGIATESSRGAGAAAVTYWVPKRSFSHNDKVTKARSELSYGTIVDQGNLAPVALKWSEGELSTDLLSESFGLFLLALFGTVVTTGPADSAFTHTYSIQEDNQHDSLALWVEDPIGDLLFKLTMIQNLEIQITPDNVVMVTIGFQSKGHDDYSNLTASYAQEKKFVGRHGSLRLAANTGALGAASVTTFKELTLRFNKNLLLDFVAGTIQAEDILNQNMGIEGEIVLNDEDRVIRDLMLDGTYQALRIQLLNDDSGDVIGASTSPEFRIDFSRVDFEAWESDRPNDAIATQRITFHALWDITNANVVNDCRLVNEVTSY